MITTVVGNYPKIGPGTKAPNLRQAINQFDLGRITEQELRRIEDEVTEEVIQEQIDAGVDLIDCSSGGNSPQQDLKPYPGYQVQFAASIRNMANIPTGAVGLITTARQAEQILADEDADVVLLGRELLRNPYWPLQARDELDGENAWPSQYTRARESRQPTETSR